MQEKLELIKGGCLGTCWYGNYHYVEPWAGCRFDCAYCYARFRTPVMERVKEEGSVFNSPVPLYGGKNLYDEIYRGAVKKNVSIAKLSRFTDLFCGDSVEKGLSLGVIKALADAKVKRIIITTKGVPDEDSLNFMLENRELFSYNPVVKPMGRIQLEGFIPPLKERIEAARILNDGGVKVTMHLDPIVPGFEDNKEQLEELFSILKSNGLNRVMFSYLLLNGPIEEIIKERFGDGLLSELLEYYEEKPVQMLPGQEETTYISYKSALRRESIERISGLLKSMGFDFVLCSLKSGRGNLKIDKNACPLCDGNFYA